MRRQKAKGKRQKSEDGDRKPETGSRKLETGLTGSSTARRVGLVCLLIALFPLLACSIPNLEEPECTAARGEVKEFYSYHFGNEMRFSAENLAPREKFLTPEFAGGLRGQEIDGDPFTTGNTDYPKAFRIGACKVVDPAKTDVEILLFWRDDVRNEQREIHAEVVKRGDAWLIDKIRN